MYPKVHVLTSCEHCDGEAYLFARVDVDTNGQPYDRYEPCQDCQGSGKTTRWITLTELADLIENAFLEGQIDGETQSLAFAWLKRNHQELH